jgi:hypothetical protein
MDFRYDMGIKREEFQQPLVNVEARRPRDEEWDELGAVSGRGRGFFIQQLRRCCLSFTLVALVNVKIK